MLRNVDSPGIQSKVVGALFAAFSMFASSLANAAFVLSNSNGDFSFIQDNSVADLNSDIGVVVVSDDIDVWDVNIVTGVTKPFLGGSDANLDLNSINVASAGATDSLSIFFGDFSFNATGITKFKTSIGGTLQNADISWQSCFEATNAFACTTIASTGSFIGEGAFAENDLFSVALSGDYLMGLLAVITPNAGNPVVVSFDYQITQVPIPTAAWLFGSAILGLGLIKRKKV